MTIAPARSSGTDIAADWGSLSTTTSPGASRDANARGMVIGSSIERRELVHPKGVSIAWLALQMIMKALGHPEELDRTTQHHPPDVNPAPLQ